MTPLATSPLERVSPAVFGTSDPVVRLTREGVRQIAATAAEQPLKRARFCAHRSPQDSLHEMLIVLARGTYIRPHRHFNKSESFHVVEGRCALVLFDESGAIQQILELGAYDSGKIFFYRLSDPTYHTLLVESDAFVVHETTNGPFQSGDCEFANWAPDADAPMANSYMADLAARVEATRRSRDHRE